MSGATEWITDYSCSPFAYPGSEYAYQFIAPFDGQVTVTLTDEEADTDLMVLDGGTPCDPNLCQDYGFSEVTFDADEGQTYYLVVDGYDNTPNLPLDGTYTISVDCVAASEQDCSDEVDEDQDGLVDCLDPDCFPGLECQPACVPDDSTQFAQLTCGSTHSWSTDGSGSNDLVDAYSCNSYPYPGSEYVYTLTVDESTDVTVSLAEETADLDVMVLEDVGLGCNPASCIDFGLTTSSFAADAGVTYYLAVDGYQGETGSYTIEVVCQ